MTPKPTPMVLSEEHDIKKKITDNFDCFVFDIDGVLVRGKDTIIGAQRTIKSLFAQNKHVYLATNNSTRTREEYEAFFLSRNFPLIPHDKIMSSSRALAKYVEKSSINGTAYVIGNTAVEHELKQIYKPGLDFVHSYIHNHKKGVLQDVATDLDAEVGDLPEMNSVLVALDSDLNYYKLSYAVSILTNPENSFVATNADHASPCSGRVMPGCGAFLSALETATNRKAIIAGKPGPIMIEQILKDSGVPKSKICMIGDNIKTDIAFARSNDIASVLVRTGVSTIEDATMSDNFSCRPDFIIPSVSELAKKE